MTKEMKKWLEEAAEKYATDRMGDQYPLLNVHKRRTLITYDNYALEEAFADGAELGYKEAIALAKVWLIEHTSADIECNENGEPLADSYIESRKLAIEMANLFESDMNKLLKD